MAVCPKCGAGVGLDAARCAQCGTTLEIVPEPQNVPIAVLKEDIRTFVQEETPEDAAAAEQQIESWQPTVGDGPAETVSSPEEAEPVAVYNAPDETDALLVASILKTDGIDATVDQHTMPMLDTSRNMEEGIWGRVLVHRKDLARASEILAAYESTEETSAEAGEEATGESGASSIPGTDTPLSASP